MGRIIHVELTSADPAKAADFYRAAFGWESEASPFVDGYLVAATGYVRDPEGTVLGLRQPV